MGVRSGLVNVGSAIVIGLSLLIGAGVYLATIRGSAEGPAAVGFEGADAHAGEPVERPGPGYAYLRVATRGLTWRDRVQGLIGLLILLFFATTALAYGIYQLGHLVNLTINRFFD
jgi:hypothetical protein